MTPDKIYLEKFPSGTIGSVWNDNIEDCGGNEPILYIRKDVLLEWLLYVKRLWSQTNSSQEALMTLQMIIDKLNSM